MPDTSPLSPAEALFLLKPNRTPGFRTVRVTLLSLLAKGILRIEESIEPGVFRDRKIPHLRIEAQPSGAPPHVAALLDVVTAAQSEGGRVRDVVKRASTEFGANCALYNSRFIVPALIGRGLIEERRILLLRSWRATPAGEAERGRIEAAIATARQLPKLLKSDPEEAAALALALGGTLLLVDGLHRHYQQLAEVMRSRGGDTGLSDGFGGGDFSAGFDLSCFDAGSFASLDACIGSFDSGFSDGGGDGGGGDSGGGGGGE